MGTHSSTAYDIVALSIARTGGAACDHSSSDLFDRLPSTLLRIFDTTGISVGARGVLADVGMTRQDCGIYIGQKLIALECYSKRISAVWLKGLALN
jgi:hypothetical protein